MEHAGQRDDMKESVESPALRSSSIDFPFPTDELLPGNDASNGERESEWTLSPLQLVFLTLGNGGLQVVWTAIMSQGSPYLFQLGVPAYLVSLIWLAGPLSGSLAHPYFGVLSDICQHPWGRRKPFIVFGTLAVIFCILALPRTGLLVDFMFKAFGGPTDGRAAILTKRVVATAWIWVLNIAMQPVQVGLKALVVDCCPRKQHPSAQAYSSCTSAIGAIYGYASGFLPLKAFGTLFGKSQFEVISVTTSLALGLTVLITCLNVKEAKPATNEVLGKKISGFATVRHAVNSIRSMPFMVKEILRVQFFAWIGWFLFLFYVTSYLGDIYQNEYHYAAHATAAQIASQVRQNSIRYGNIVMTIFAFVALLSNIIFPFIVTTAARHQISRTTTKPKLSRQSSLLAKIHSASILPFSWLTVPRLWSASLLLYSTIILSTSFTQARIPSSLLIASLGISWGATQWAPLVLLSEEIAKHAASKRGDRSPEFQESYRMESSDDTLLDSEEMNHPGAQSSAGAILGVYNISIAAPQIVAAIGSSAMFWLLGFWGVVDEDAIGWVIRTGSVTTSIAAFLAAGIEID